jgi:hypothetical protein
MEYMTVNTEGCINAFRVTIRVE